MHYIIKTISFITISILLIGCSGGSAPSVKHKKVMKYSPEDGLVDTPAEKQRIAKLMSSRPNIERVFADVVKKQKKGRYESSEEYAKRMKSINAYAVMSIDIKKSYDPDTKIYKVRFKMAGDNIGSFASKYSQGVPTYNPYVYSDNEKRHMGLEGNAKNSSYSDWRSNAYGATVKVDHHTGKSYLVHADNFQKLANMKGMYYYSITIPADKEKAKRLDRQRLKLKAGVSFVDPETSMYRSAFANEATIDNPTSYSSLEYGFNGHIKEMVLYTNRTKEILFQFAD